MKTNFHMKGWAPRLALKKRPKVIRKWSNLTSRSQLACVSGYSGYSREVSLDTRGRFLSSQEARSSAIASCDFYAYFMLRIHNSIVAQLKPWINCFRTQEYQFVRENIFICDWPQSSHNGTCCFCLNHLQSQIVKFGAQLSFSHNIQCQNFHSRNSKQYTCVINVKYAQPCVYWETHHSSLVGVR